MKRFILGAAILGLVLGPVGQANADLITFEGLGNQGDAVTKIGIANFTSNSENPILTQVGSPEVAYVTATGSDDITGNNGPAGTDLGNFYITDPIINGNIFVPNPITVTFDVPVTGVSFFVLDLDGAQIPNRPDVIETVTAQIFDNGTLVDALAVTDMGTDTSNGSGDAFGTWFNFNNSTPITSLDLVITRPDNLAGWGVDNLAFAPVPEPGTLLLLGTGFVGMGTMVRRRSRRK